MSDGELTDIDKEHANSMREIGMFSLKTLFVVNSGAAVILLSFLGKIATSDSQDFDISLCFIKAAMICFIFGIFFALLAALLVHNFIKNAIGEIDPKKIFGYENFNKVKYVSFGSFAAFSAGVLFAVFAVTNS